ncbi:MAG TPA: SDR family oxidoreductase [Geopsychrobacteraceae bacterium]
MRDVLIIGCGDIGGRVARMLLEKQAAVTALVRSEEKAAELRAAGLATLIGNLDYGEETPELPINGATVFYMAPPPGGGFSDYRMVNFCRRIAADNRPEKMVYLSTSGVYGDCGGAVVTEATPLNPQTSRAKRRVDAERQLQEAARTYGFPLVILRVTGIYGPNRLPLARLHQGHPVLREEEAPRTNRIHSVDLARICLAAAEKGAAGDIFNVSDGQESTMTRYFNAVADLYELPRPQQISREEARQVMNPLMLSYLNESRRMDNRKLLEKLGIALLYPTLETGLKACREDP